MALLMTPTLWNSIDWYEKCPASWKKSAYQGILDMLNRKFTPNAAIQKGMDFEQEICYGKLPEKHNDPEVFDKLVKAYNMIHDSEATFQAKAKKIVTVDNKEFLLYGKIDVLLPNLIIDIKTTSSYRGKDSYLTTWQPPVYCYCTQQKDFLFIVFEFDNFGLLADVYFIEYHVDDFVKLKQEVQQKLDSVITFLRNDPKLKQAYINKFNLYN